MDVQFSALPTLSNFESTKLSSKYSSLFASTLLLLVIAVRQKMRQKLSRTLYYKAGFADNKKETIVQTGQSKQTFASLIGINFV